MNEKAVHVVRK